MKKVLILSICLLLVATSAMAGTAPVDLKRLTDDVGLVYVQLDGVADIQVEEVYDLTIVTYTMEDASMPNYRLVISHSDLLDGKDITDLSEEELGQLVAYTALDAEEFSYAVVEMEDGWPAVVIDYEGESDWTDAFTLISGYLIQMHGYHDDFSPLTDEESAYAFTLLDSVDVVNTAE